MPKGADMLMIIVKFVATVLGEALRVAAQSMLKAAIAAAMAALLKGVIEGLKQGVSKARANRAAAPA